MYYQVNFVFLGKIMMDFLPLVKLKCHDNFHHVIPITLLKSFLAKLPLSLCFWQATGIALKEETTLPLQKKARILQYTKNESLVSFSPTVLTPDCSHLS